MQELDIAVREDGLFLTNIKAKNNIKMELATPKGVLKIEYQRWEDED